MKKKAAEIPQLDKNWYVFYSLLRTWVKEEEEKPIRPYVFVAVEVASQFFLNFEILSDEPTSEKILELIYETIASPKIDGIPKHRPKTIKFEDKLLADEVKAELNELGIKARYVPNRKMSKAIIREITSHMTEDQPEMVSLSSKPGLTLPMKRAFYRAAAEFFRAEPWVYLTNEDILSVQIPPHDPYYVIVMGNGGMEYGLIIFKTLADLENYYHAEDNIEARIPDSGWHVLDYEENFDVPFDDLDEIELNDFEIAAENAYPIPVTYFKDRTHDRPSREMVLWYQDALQAIARFTQKVFQSDQSVPTEETSYRFDIQTGKHRVEAQILFPVADAPQRSTVTSLGYGSLLESTGFGTTETDDLDQMEAQEIVYDIWEEPNPQERIEMAQYALSLDPLCVDAYVILADDLARTDQEKLDFFQKGVEAGEKRLGEQYFEERTGHFWGFVETRPYMRALNGVGNTLWAMKEHKKAEKIYRRMLELNPGDNQGIRFILVQLLLDMEKYRQAEKLIKEYKDYNAYSLFTHALLKYQKNGPGKSADKLLLEADEYNPFVKAYLTGKKKIPHESPFSYVLGSEDEAVLYAEAHLNHWRKIPGAFNWLKTALGK